MLAHSKLGADQLAALTDNLKSAGPLELNKLCEAFDGGGDEALGGKLLDALRHQIDVEANHRTAESIAEIELRPDDPPVARGATL